MPRPHRRKLHLETCEDRILCSASVPASASADPPYDATLIPVQTAEFSAPHTPDATLLQDQNATAAASVLTDAQRQAIEAAVRDSTNQIWFEKNVGQFGEGVRYGFRTAFGAVLVFDDHLQLIANQHDPETGTVGVQAVDITFTDSPGNWQIVPGGMSGVSGSYQQTDGSSLQPDIFKELTLRNVYAGIDLRLYSAENGVLEFDWIVARAEDYAKIGLQFHGQDGITYDRDGGATLDLRYQDISLKMPETYQVIDGVKHYVEAKMVAGSSPGEMRYTVSGDLAADQPLVIDPNVAWATYFDLDDSTLPFDSYLFAVTANANGVYAFGWVKETVTNAVNGAYMQVNAGFSEGTVANQAYLYRLDTSGLNITGWTSTGVTSSTGSVSNQALADAPSDLELFPDGRVLAGFTSGRLQIYSADLATRSYSAEPVTVEMLNAIAIVDNNTFYTSGRVNAAIPIAQIPAANVGPDSTFAGATEGYIIRFSNAAITPTPDWATYVGGNANEYYTTIGLTPDKTKLAFATATQVGAAYSGLVNAVDSTIAGTTELLVGVLPEQATKPAAFSVFSYLGGSGNEGTIGTNTTSAVLTATNSYFYVAGNTASTDVPGATGSAQTANGGGTFDAFVSRIPLNGSAGTGFRTSYLGGAAEDNIGGLAYDSLADRILLFGSTAGSFPVQNTTPASNYYDSTFGGGTWDIFVAIVSSDLTTKEYATYIGGTQNDYLGQTGDLIGQGHVFYSADTGLTYLGTTVHSADIPSGVIGTPPGKDTGKSNTTNDSHVVFAFNVNIFDYGDAPVTFEGSPVDAARDAPSSTLKIGATFDTEAGPASGAAATGDDTSNTGAADDEDGIASVPLLVVGDTSYSATVSVMNNTGSARTLHGWVDFNRNGTFEIGEYASVSVPTSVAQQNVTLTWASVPVLTAGQSYVRIRITDAALADNAGTASIDERSIGLGGSGEVEDYALAIAALPSISINDVTVNEAAGTATFTVSLDQAGVRAISVNYATSDGAAAAGSDYTSTSGTANFAVGITSQTITVPITNDALFENSETFNVNLSGAVNATIADALGVGTIRDDGTGSGGTDNDTPTLAVSNVAVTEGTDAYTVFTVSLSNASTTAVDFNLALSNGSALGSGTDYGTSGAGNLQVSTNGGVSWADATSATIAAGSTSVLVRTPVVNDTLDENAETFTLTATRTSGTTTNVAAVGAATITDNDPQPSFSINDVTVNEATGNATFTVTLNTASGLATSVNYATSNGTAAAAADYTSASGTLNFAAGVVSQTISVPILNDAVFENSETFNVNLSGAVNATIADALGVGTIRDDGTGTGGTDNDTPTLAVSNVAVTEGTDAYGVFTVSLSNVSTTAVTFSLALANVSATGGGTDYGTSGAGNLQVSTNGGATWADAASATIAAGTTSLLVRTPIVNDALDEAAETFTLTATRTAGTTTNAVAAGTATITDNDPPPSVSVDDVTVNEAAGTATFTVTLDAPSGQAITVTYNTSNGTATAGADYTSTSGTLNFAAGVTSQTITVPILNDATFENSETFNVLLTGSTNAVISDGLGIGTIRDDGTGTGGTDNDTPTLAVSNVAVTEGTDAFAVFTVSLSNASTTAVDVSLALANVTATGGAVDYGSGGPTNLQVSTNGGASWANATTATIAAGTTSVLVRTPIVNDTLDENAETFTLTATRTAGTTTNAGAGGTGTITDDDPAPSFSVNDVTVNEATGNATFTVTLNTASGLATSVNYATSNGTATAGADYTSTSGTLNFAAGVVSQTITVPILNDAVFENSEAFNVNLSGAVNATITDALGVGTIRDDGTGTGGTDNDTPTLAVSNVAVTEGTDAYAVFTVSLSNASTTAVTANLALANVSATGSGTDYGTSGAGNLQVSTNGGATWADAASTTIAAGTLSVLVRTPIVNDALDEAAETFTLTATRTAGTTTNASAAGTATIADNDPTPSLTINDVTVNEATGNATFTVTLSAASGLPVSVNYATSNGTATAGADYTSASGTLNFAAGAVTQTITVPILNDVVFENSEAFNVNLSGAVNATIADALGVGTIRDDGTGTGGADNDTPTLAVSNVAVTEGTDAYAVFTVSLSNASTTAVTANLALANVSAAGSGTDYGTSGAGNLQVSTNGGATWADAASATIAAGTTSALVRTPIVNDSLDENAETFTLTATRTAGTTTNASAVGTATITDDDPTPSLSIDSVTVNEAAGTATFTVTLSAASGQAVSVAYATSNGTALAGADYTSTSGTLNFAAGVVSQTITVPILNDAVFENSEAFNVNLSGAVNATIADALGVGTIRDDGTGTGGTDNDTPTLAVSNVAVTEGTDGYAIFAVSLSNASTTAVDMALALANGAAAGNGTDYGASGAGNLQVSTNGGATWADAASATIAAGTTSVLVRTPIANDALDEAAETFTLTATRAAGTTTNASAVGTATITDDDPTPSFSINDVTVNEAAGTAVFTVTLSAASGQATSVNYATSNGTATAGSDYTSASGTLNFGAGALSQTFVVPILNDAVFENSEAFNVNLSGAVNATITDALGVGTIRDDGTGSGGTDNDTPTLAVSNVAVTEGTDAFAVFTVSLSNTSTTAVTANLALANVSATGSGTDYGTSGAGNLQVSTNGGATWADAASATIAAGTTSVLVRTPIVNDLLDENAETFTLTATRTAGTTTNASAVGTATITDDDPTPSFSINDVTVNEATGNATFTVTLNTASGQATSVNYATSNGTATAGADYTSTSGTLNFVAGAVTQTITVPILNDAVFENSEAFNVNLSGAVNATIADALGVGTIRDDGTGTGGTDNDTPTLAVSNVAVTEGTDAFAVFAVSLSNASTTAVTANLALANVSAAGSGTDYGTSGAGNLQVSTNGGATWADAASATIAAGTTSVLVRTPIVNDALDEAVETFTLTATRTAGTTTNASAVGTATITDDDPTPSLSIDSVTVNEAAGTATFTVTLSAASGEAVSVAYATSDGTALAGADYTSTSGTLNFAPGVTSTTIVVPILNDTLFEVSEGFTVSLSAPVNATIVTGTGTGTIRDDGAGSGGTDDDTPTVAVSNIAVSEGNDPYAIFTVSLSNASTSDVDLTLPLNDGTANSAVDFGAGNPEVSLNGGATWTTTASATIAAGSTSILVRTAVLDDMVSEPIETFTLDAVVSGGTTTNAGATGTASITDNDGTPTIAINNVTVNEGAGTATFTVTLSAPSALGISVDFATVDGTATDGADYTGVTGTVNFLAGVTTQTIVVPILNDALFEGSEGFTVFLSSAVNATIADDTGAGTILDNGAGSGGTDNDTPTLSVNNVAVTEGSDAHAVFTVSLSNASTTPVSFGLALANGTATGGGVDFGATLEVSTDGGASWIAANSATIAAGTTSLLVRTPIANDAFDESAETFSLSATRSAGTTTNASAAGTATITDDDATPSLSIDDVTVNEAAGTATFTVTLSAASGLPVSVNYATSNGTATVAADYTGVSGTLNFAAGETTQTIVVPILNDATFENSETFNVNLSGAVNATIADALGVGTILDDGTGSGGIDDDTPALAVSDVAVTEGTDSDAIFTVSLSNPSTQPTSVNLALANVSATGGGTDYGTGGAGNLQVSTNGGATWADATSATIAAGTTSVLVRTPIVNDALDETAETFTLTATRTAGTTTNASAVGTATITDDDPTPSLSIDSVTVNEAAGTATFTVTLSAASGQAVSVDYATSDGTATSGADYTATTGTLNFATGVVSQTITVPITNDAVFENSETFNVILSTPSNATISTGTGVGTIRDDGTGSGGTDDDTPTVAVSDVTVVEGVDPHAVFTVSISNASAAATTFNLTLADGTATAADYGSGLEVSTDGGATWNPSTVATIAAGSTSVLVRTPILNDALSEAFEDFTLTAARTAGTTTNASALGTATITDDDGLPLLFIDDVTVNEAAGTATFTVTMNAASGQPVSVNFATSDGTATAGADYTAASGTVNFAPGIVSRTITVPIFNDAVFENGETFDVNVSGAVNAIVADATGLGTIRDDGTGLGGVDDDTPTLAVTNVPVTEGTDAYAVFNASLSNASATAVTFNLLLANGTASGADYGPGLEVSTNGGLSWNAAANATIAAGGTNVLVRTPITDDLLSEANETFTLDAIVTAGTTTNPSATGTATISDDDPTPTLSIDNVSVNEAAGTATFTVTLSAMSGQPVSVNYATSNGAAIAGADYTAVSGTLNFAAGIVSQTITVPILDDAIFENSESFSVILSAPSAATIASGTGLGTIHDDGTGTGGTDDDTPTLAVSNVTAIEGTDPHAVFSVSLSNASTSPVSFNLALADGTALGAGTDYGASGAGNLQVSTNGGATWSNAANATIAAGSTSVLVRTPVANDALDEAAETFTLTATRTVGTTTNASAAGTGMINDDDPTPTLSIDDVSVNEAAGTLVFTVSLNAQSGQAVSVNFATADGSALAGADYTAIGGTLNFAPGSLTRTIAVPILNDSLFEVSEGFTMQLSGAVNAVIADVTGAGTIRDDGTGPGGVDDDTPTLAVSNVTALEGTDAHAVFTVSLSNPSTTAVDLALPLADLTATIADYGPGIEISTDGGATWTPSATATFAPGATSILVRTPAIDDLLDEAAETFTLTPTVTSGVTTNGSAIGTATIVDDDAPPTLSVGDVSVNEAAGTATFTVSLSRPSGLAISANYTTGDVTAVAGGDYDATGGVVNFAPGETSKTVTVSILDDTIFENSESFDLLLGAAVNATIADAIGIGTIHDDGTGLGGTDDDRPAVSIGSPTVTEGIDRFAVFAVDLSTASTASVTLDLAFADVTANGAGRDYGAGSPANLQVSTDGGTTWSNATAITFAPGATSALVRTRIVNDLRPEPTETFTLTATLAAGIATNSPVTGTGTILNGVNGSPDLYVAKSDGLTEARVGDTLTYLITGGNRGDLPSGAVTVRDMLPAGVRLVSASNGGHVANGEVVWDLGVLPPGGTFELRLTVVVEAIPAGGQLENAVSIAHSASGDPNPNDNSATDTTSISSAFSFGYDVFNNFSTDKPLPPPIRSAVSSIDLDRAAVLPLAPIYSGEADPGSTLVVDIYNAKGERIGSQTVVADSGGNWLATFPTTTLRDSPNTARITQFAPTYSLNERWGNNLRTYFTPALNAGHFSLDFRGGADLSGESAPLLSGLSFEDPLQLGAVKYAGEFLSSQSTASGQ